VQLGAALRSTQEQVRFYENRAAYLQRQELQLWSQIGREKLKVCKAAAGSRRAAQSSTRMKRNTMVDEEIMDKTAAARESRSQAKLSIKLRDQLKIKLLHASTRDFKREMAQLVINQNDRIAAERQANFERICATRAERELVKCACEAQRRVTREAVAGARRKKAEELEWALEQNMFRAEDAMEAAAEIDQRLHGVRALHLDARLATAKVFGTLSPSSPQLRLVGESPY